MRWWIYLTRVYAATTSFQGSANACELLSFKLFGRGLVRGVTRLAFKASAVACGGSSPTSDLTGGDAVGLTSANVAGEIYVCVTGVFGFVPWSRKRSCSLMSIRTDIHGAGTEGTISFTLDLTSSLAGTLRVCMSSNGGEYVTVPSLSGFTIAARLVLCVCTNADSYTPPIIDDMGVDMQT